MYAYNIYERFLPKSFPFFHYMLLRVTNVTVNTKGESEITHKDELYYVQSCLLGYTAV
jgi:hypothetical protein